MLLSAPLALTPTKGAARFVLSVAQIVAPVFFMSFLYRKHRKQIEMSTNEDDDALMLYKLFPSEAKFYNTDMPCISTLTWFHGDYKQQQVHVFVQERMKKIMQTNPWLFGRIIKRQGVYYVAHSKKISKEVSISLGDYFELVPEEESPLSRDKSPIGDWGLLTRKYMIKNGPNEPLLKVTLVPCQDSPRTRFAIIFQLSHVVGDGATFYKLHEMLCSTDEALLEQELIFDRVDNFEKDSAELLGKEEHGFVTSASYICLLMRGMLSTLLFGPKTEFKFALVDHNKIQLQKENAIADIASSAAKSDNDNDNDENCVSFVSTNDIITSWFLSNTGCTYGIMPINLRNRLKGITFAHAGNYENVVFYQCPTDSSSPSLIRRSIMAMKRTVTSSLPVPGFLDVVSKSCAIVTNWQTFAKPNVIPGCEEDLHAPIAPISVWASTMPFLLVFRAGGSGDDSNKDRIGVCLFQTRTNYLTSMPFLSEQVLK